MDGSEKSHFIKVLPATAEDDVQETEVLPDNKVKPSQSVSTKHNEWVAVSKPVGLPTWKKAFIGLVVVGIIAGTSVAVGLYFVLGVNGPFPTVPPVDNANETTTAESATIPTYHEGTYKWSQWSQYSACDKTCGSGYKQRSRTCLEGTCIGSEYESARCNELVCARKANQYNTWFTWGPWSECGASCGDSLRQRERTCRGDTNKKECVGSSIQKSMCNLGTCPDCAMACDGTWNEDCFVCECSDTFMSGRVITKHGGPMENVRITPNDKEYVNVTVTEKNGAFYLNDLCNGQELRVKYPGYQTQMLVFDPQTNLTIVLNKIVPLTITKQPQNKARLTSSCVQFYCEAAGFPEPEYYEWFKEGMLMEGETNGVLSLTAPTPIDSGYYSCRANNDYGAVLSNEFQFSVKDSQNEFCVTSPIANNQNLPTGCLYNDQRVVNVGKCATGFCSKGNEQCHEGNNVECGVLQSETVHAECTSHQLPIQIVKECGCIEKEATYLEVLGIVVDSVTGNVIAGVEIRSGSVVYESSSDGDFIATLVVGSTRTVFALHDPMGRYSDQVSSLDLNQDLAGTVEHVIRMTPKASPIIVSAANEIVVELGSDGESEPFADIIIPANTLYRSDGELFEGDVSISISTFDPRNDSLDTNPPGDFSAVGDEGQQEMLQSVGMMQLRLKDTAGNSLNVGGEVEIMIPDGQISNNDDTDGLKLWSLNTDTGRWEYAADITSQPQRRRKKRYAYATTVRGIDIDSEWFNFDYISDQICHTKIRVYQTDEFLVNEQLSGADVQIVTLPSADSDGTTLTRYRSWSDDISDENGYCIVHPCNSQRSPINHQYHGYVIVDYNGMTMKPSNDTFDDSMQYQVYHDKLYAKFDYTTAPDGPFYDWDYYWGSSSKCSDADAKAKHFRFYQGDQATCKAKHDDYTRMKRTKSLSPTTLNLFAWEYPSNVNSFSACFVKVITTWDSDTKVEATSMVQHAENNVLTDGDIFGVRTECTVNRAACLEVRSPFGVTDGVQQYTASTKVDIKIVGVDAIGKFPRRILLDNGNVVSSNDPNIIQLLLTKDTYGPEYGVYCSESSQNYAQAKKRAQRACRVGTSDPNEVGHGNYKKDITTTGWAVWFGENGKCPGGHISPRQCPSLSTDLESYEYCNEDGFVCWSCPLYDATEKVIPEYINDAGQCKSENRYPLWEGCCPSCPSGYSFGPCNISDYSNTIHEYCNPPGIICPTCPLFNTFPEYPNSTGQCDNPDYELDYAGCCPPRPLCPNGFEPLGYCNGSLAYSSYYEYCTPEGLICDACYMFYYDYDMTEKVIPEYPNEDGSCDDPSRSLHWDGCCPSCPGGQMAYEFCNNQTGMWNENEYCFSGEYVCQMCPIFDTIPAEVDNNGQCNNSEHELVQEGCCPFRPKCPGGYPTEGTCNSTDSLGIYSLQYCTDEGYVCHTCYHDWMFEFDKIIPLHPNNDSTCENPNYKLFWEGCCPVCPGGQEALGLCDQSTALQNGVYCTSHGVICKSCPGDSIPGTPTIFGNCSSPYEQDDGRGCCPSCPSGISDKLNETCSATGTSYILTSDTFCSPLGLVCPTCPIYSSAIPEYSINVGHQCDNPTLENSCAGCCPSAPKCPGSKTMCPSSVCSFDSECNSGEYCTQDGVCCQLSTCRLASGNIYGERVNSTTSECDGHASYLTLDGCCPVDCFHLDYGFIYAWDVFGEYYSHSCSSDLDCYYAGLYCAPWGMCESLSSDALTLLGTYFVNGLPLCNNDIECQASNSSSVTGECHYDGICCQRDAYLYG